MLQVCFLNKPPFGVCGGSPLPKALPPPGPQWPQRSLLFVPTLTCSCHPPPSTFRHRRGWNPVPVFLGEETSPFPQYPVPSAGRGRAPLGMGFPLYLALGCVLCCNHPTSAKDKFSSHLNKHLRSTDPGPAVRVRQGREPPTRQGLHFGLVAYASILAPHHPGHSHPRAPSQGSPQVTEPFLLVSQTCSLKPALFGGEMDPQTSPLSPARLPPPHSSGNPDPLTCVSSRAAGSRPSPHPDRSPWRCPISCLLSTPKQGVRSHVLHHLLDPCSLSLPLDILGERLQTQRL